MQQSYTIIHTSQKTSSLVLLQQQRTIIHQMFKTKQSKFIWYDPNPSYHIKQQIEHDLDINFICFTDVDKMLKFIQADFVDVGSQSYVVVWGTGLKGVDGLAIKGTKNMVKVVCLKPGIWDGDAETEEDKDLEDDYSDKDTYQSIQSKERLYEFLENQKWKQLMSRQLPNFISVKKDIWTSNIMVKTIFAMLNQENNTQTRQKLIQQMSSLISKISKYNIFYKQYQKKSKQFIEQIKTSELSPQRAIYWYTSQSSVYRLLNNLLRSAKHPSEIFYVQPYFKDLFSAVKEVYNKSDQKEKLVFYRGGIVTEEEIGNFQKNIGGVVQNLGFLSTSESKATASAFMTNILFQIHVDPTKMKNQYGFARISNQSQYKNQQQILFNPLNKFKILQFTRKSKSPQSTLYFVKLASDELASMAGKTENKVRKQLKILESLNNIQNNLMESVRCFGDVLIDQTQVLKGAELYCRKYCEIAVTYQERIKGLYMKGLTNLHMSQFTQALENFWLRLQLVTDYGNQLEKQLKLCQVENTHNEVLAEQIRKNKLDEATTLHNIGKLQLKQQNTHEAAISLQKCRQIRQQILGQTHVDYAAILRLIGLNHHKQGNLKQALQLYLQCKRIQEMVVGEFHPDYSSILNNQAVVYMEQGEYRKALQLYYQCKYIGRSILGQNHPDYLITLNNIGIAYSKLHNQQFCFKYLRKCEKISKKIQGQDHHFYGIIVYNIALYHQKKNNISQALKLYLQASRIWLKNNGNQDGGYLLCLYNVGVLLFMGGDYGGALGYLEDSREFVMRGGTGFNSLCLSGTGFVITPISKPNFLYILTSTYFHLKKYSQALQILSLPQPPISQLPSDPDLINASQKIAQINWQMGHFQVALLQFQKIYESRNVLGQVEQEEDDKDKQEGKEEKNGMETKMRKHKELEIFCRIANLRFFLGDYWTALRMYLGMIRMCDRRSMNNEQGLYLSLVLIVGQIYKTQQSPSKARSWLRQKKLNPRHKIFKQLQSDRDRKNKRLNKPQNFINFHMLL